MTTGIQSQWLDYTLKRINAIRPESIDHFDRKALARKIVRFAEVDDDLFPSPSVWSDEAECVHLQWQCTFGTRGTLEIVVDKPASFVASFWRPGQPTNALRCQGDFTDSVRRIFGEFNGEPMGVSVAEVMEFTEIRK